jgi:hypothetical protein
MNAGITFPVWSGIENNHGSTNEQNKETSINTSSQLCIEFYDIFNPKSLHLLATLFWTRLLYDTMQVTGMDVTNITNEYKYTLILVKIRGNPLTMRSGKIDPDWLGA